MKNSHIRLIIGLMAFSMLGLVFLQYQWIQETKSTKQAQFDLTVNDVMDKVAQKIERLEAASMITQNFPKPKKEYLKAMVSPLSGDEKHHTHAHKHEKNENHEQGNNHKHHPSNDKKLVSHAESNNIYTAKQEVYHPIVGLELSLHKAHTSAYGTGLYVEKVEKGGIAEMAGIEKGDILLGINGKPINNHLELKKLVSHFDEEVDVYFTFSRNKELKTSPSVLETNKIEEDPNHSKNRLFLGVFCKDARTEHQENPTEGVLITDVIGHTTADEAGLEKDDILVGIGEQKIHKVKDIKKALSHYSNGDRVAIEFWREGKKHTNHAALKATEEEEQGNVNWKVSSATMRIQAYIEELSKLDKSLLEIDEMYQKGDRNRAILGVFMSESDDLEGGIMIDKIIEGGPAYKAGLLKSDILTSVNNIPVSNTEDLHAALQSYTPGDQISIGFRRRKEERLQTETTIYKDDQKITISQERDVNIETDEVETLARLMNKEDILWAHVEKQFRTMANIVIENLLVEVPLQDRVSPELLENTLAAFLEDAGIDIPYQYCLASNDEVIYSKSAQQISCMSGANVHRKKLFNDAVYAQPGELILHFPEQDKYILRSSAMMLGSSILFNLIIILTFAYTIHTILRQKKLSEMKTDFINNMTHELKTPISTIKLATEILTDKTLPKTGGRIDRYANIIHEENERLESHVEKVLQYARIEKDTLKLNMEAVDMHKIIQEAIGKIGLQVSKKGGTINCTLDADTSVVEGDRLHLTNVVYNLLDNANKYSKGAPTIMVLTQSTPKGLLVAVKDEGIGMTKETLKRIFDKFYRVPTGNIHNVKGFGLGLSYVKNMVEAHQGEVTARSRINKGSTIEFSLPVQESKEAYRSPH